MGYPEHVGYVVEVVDNSILVIEGNFNRKVNYRTIKVDGFYIRGYATPRYEELLEKNEFTTVQYVVKEGDTLSNIASMYQKSVESLAMYNKIADPNKIYVGSIIQIPQDTKVYIVKKGDCLSGIARMFHTTVNKLKNDNNIINPDFIYVGQEIKIYL